MAEWTRPKFPVRSGTTALVVIDMQNDFVHQGAPYESTAAREMIDNLNRLIGACREAGIPVIFTAHAHRADGSDLGAVRHIHPLTSDGHALKAGTPGVQLYPKVDVGDTDYVIEKRRYRRVLRHRPRAPAPEPRRRHPHHRRRRHQRLL